MMVASASIGDDVFEQVSNTIHSLHNPYEASSAEKNFQSLVKTVETVQNGKTLWPGVLLFIRRGTSTLNVFLANKSIK